MRRISPATICESTAGGQGADMLVSVGERAVGRMLSADIRITRAPQAL